MLKTSGDVRRLARGILYRVACPASTNVVRLRRASFVCGFVVRLVECIPLSITPLDRSDYP